jgi:hypothetical protein
MRLFLETQKRKGLDGGDSLRGGARGRREVEGRIMIGGG